MMELELRTWIWPKNDVYEEELDPEEVSNRGNKVDIAKVMNEIREKALNKDNMENSAKKEMI